MIRFIKKVLILHPHFFASSEFLPEGRKNGLNDGMEGVTAARGRKGSITKDFLSWGIPFL
ncbi:hypothetical protein EAJ02_12975 [Phocaeicola dorei]|jgi:hypothetical protein|nr:hypothetical protein F2A23_14460 [Akkermansia sp. BIOML-A63]RYT94029.1 hypothetical protein EAJ02_12975 [Phocaeicola dorei]